MRVKRPRDLFGWREKDRRRERGQSPECPKANNEREKGRGEAKGPILVVVSSYMKKTPLMEAAEGTVPSCAR